MRDSAKPETIHVAADLLDHEHARKARDHWIIGERRASSPSSTSTKVPKRAAPRTTNPKTLANAGALPAI